MRLATLRILALPDDGEFAGPLFALREDAEAAAHLDHPRVLATRDVGRHGGQTYVVSAHTPAVPLSDHLRRPLTPSRALTLLGPVAAALDAAAHGGLPHGAVHPRSIWVEPDPARPGARRALLSGFGLHHVLRVLAVRRDAEVAEDFLYTAPELVRGGRPSNRSDQYALAAALLHAMTGRPPFQRDHLADLFGDQRFARPPSVDHGIAGAAALDEIMLRALAKNPDQRFDGCRDFIAAVAAWERDHRPAGAAAHASPAPAPVGPARPSQSSLPSATPEPQPQPEPGREPERRPRRTPRRKPSSIMRGAPALAVVAVLIGVVSALVLLARLPSSAPQADEVVAAATAPTATAPAVTAATAPAATAATAPAATATGSDAAGLRWRQRLEAPAIGLHVIPAGMVAVTRRQVVVLDPETGQIRGRLGGRQASSAVTADGGLVTAGTDGVQARDVDDGTVEWTSDVTGVRPPDVTGQTIYRVSDGAVPRLVATAAGTGRRLWEFPEDEAAFPAEAEIAPDVDFVYVADREAVYGILPEGESIGTDTKVIDAGDTAPEPLLVWRTDNQQLWLSSLQALSDGVVAADRSGDVCLRRDADGDAVWCVAVAGVAAGEPVLFDDDSVYVVTGAAVTAIDAGTGDQRWTRPGAWSQAVLAADGRMVAVDRDGRVAVLAVDTGGIRGLDGVRVPSAAVLAVAGDALYAAGGDGDVVSVDLGDPMAAGSTG